MKNFKRVISAVIALALSASTLVAVNAAKFADVDSKTANAEAIDVLAALDIIHGYDEEDGLVFKPEGEITRAEAAVMIVGALNMNKDAEAAAGYSKFTDVNEKASWASGFVNVGVAQGYINGMDDTTFAPQENVTYAQMCVMLTLITGYGDYAAANGGYPTGYMAMASSAGINKGVALSADTPLKRGQVAQMLYNAITAPVLGITAYKLDGNTYEKLDGSNKAKKTVLSDKFDGIEIKANVDAFGTTAGTVNLDITDACGYDEKGGSDSWKKFTVGAPISGTIGALNGVIIDNDLDLSGYLQQEIKAVLTVDENGKMHLVNVKGTSAVETIELAADSYTSTEYNTNKQIKYGTTKYTFMPGGVDIYVNGDLYKPLESADATIKGILEKAVGTVKFAKTGGAANYNAIFVDVYHIGQVTTVEYKGGVTTVKFSSTYADNILTTPKKIEITDNDIETEAVKVTVKLDDEEIELKDLQENDVIAIKTEFTTGGASFGAANKNITVLATRETISGQLTSKEDGTNENAFTIDSEVYAAVNKATIDLKVGEKYNTIYLDPLGRLYSYNDEAVEETKNYAILAKVADQTDITLVLPDGTKKAYEAKDATVYAAGTVALEVSGTVPAGVRAVYPADIDADNSGTVNAGDTDYNGNGVLDPAEDATACVVEYTVKKGQISEIKNVAGTAFTNEKYKEAVNKIATVGISSATGIINVQGATTYKDYEAMKMRDLIDEETYTGAGFGKIGTTNNYSLVIFTVAGYDYGANSRFAVVASDAFQQGSDDEGFAVWQLKVLLNGEKTTLNFTNAAKTAFGATNIGDTFFYVLDADGDVKATDKIARTTVSTPGLFTSLPFVNGTYSGAKWTGNLTTTGSQKIQLVRGIVVGGGSSSVRIIETPTAGQKAVDIDAFESYTLADDCVIYTYDTDSEIDNDKDRLDEEGTLQISNFKNWRVTDTAGATVAPFNASASNGKIVWDIAWTTDPDDPSYVTPVSTVLKARGISEKLFDQLTTTKKNSSNVDKLVGYTAADSAQYAMALIVDDQVVEIYEVIQ